MSEGPRQNSAKFNEPLIFDIKFWVKFLSRKFWAEKFWPFCDVHFFHRLRVALKPVLINRIGISARCLLKSANSDDSEKSTHRIVIFDLDAPRFRPKFWPFWGTRFFHRSPPAFQPVSIDRGWGVVGRPKKWARSDQNSKSTHRIVT
jgi:hypothetical protein